MPRGWREAVGRLMGRQADDRGRPWRAPRLRGARRGQRAGPGASGRRAPREAPAAASATPPERLGRDPMGRLYDATWGRGFTALYDRCFKATEEAGLREMRQELLTGARGRVVELGAGTGAQPRALPGRRSRTGPGRARPAHDQAAARAKLAESGQRGRGRRGAGAKSCRSRTTASTPPWSRWSSARSRTRRRRWLRSPASSSRAASCSSSSTSAPRAGPGPLAGPPREALALPRRRLPLQPRHRRDDRRFARSTLGDVEHDKLPKARRSSNRWSAAARPSAEAGGFDRLERGKLFSRWSRSTHDNGGYVNSGRTAGGDRRRTRAVARRRSPSALSLLLRPVLPALRRCRARRAVRSRRCSGL